MATTVILKQIKYDNENKHATKIHNMSNSTIFVMKKSNGNVTFQIWDHLDL